MVWNAPAGGARGPCRAGARRGWGGELGADSERDRAMSDVLERAAEPREADAAGLGDASACLAAARAERDAGRLERAGALLAGARARFPDEVEPLVESGWLAQVAGDWPVAAHWWAEVRRRPPHHLVGFVNGAAAVGRLGLPDEAERLLAEAVARYPGQPAPWIELATLAQRRGDWPQAARRWAEARARFPDSVATLLGAARAARERHRHDEADAALREAISRFPAARDAWTEYAWLASVKRDWPEAARRWAEVRARFPEHPEAYLRGAMALSESWDHAAADTVLRAALARFPGDSRVALEFAALALRQNQLDDAASRYEQARARFPLLAEAHLGAATVLRNRFRLAEAQALLEAAGKLLPDEPRLVLAHAMLPVFAPLRRDRDPEETLRRLAALRLRFPDWAEGLLASIRELRAAERLDEAQALAAAAAARLPASAALLAEAGATAMRRRDWAEAERCYRLARERFPDEAGGCVGLAQVLAATGQGEAAETTLREAIARFPTEAAVHTAYAELAQGRRDWPEALARWRAAQALFPDDKAFAQRAFDVQLNLVGEGGGEAAAALAPDDDPRAAVRELVMRFESLGGRGLGCEFGMVQREFGAEPLGLLRWADMPYEGTVFALETRFAGVGLPENTEVSVNRENARPEYITRDRRGFMFMRAFVYEDEAPIERMRKQALRRLVFLRDKLIADLEAGGKIFVWRCTERTLTEAELARLHRAVRGYGDNMLLYVRLADASHPNGTVELAAPGLMIGYIDRFKLSPEGVLASAPASASWLALCRAADALWSAARPPISPPVSPAA